ncbi:mambaquaretin-5-like [Tachypleus tridentatus]|uniref:mambaquaretin-5-like n=1 Tax=Tachypleus tridentatus TaxID=6853 RepID=UPI003FD5031D
MNSRLWLLLLTVFSMSFLTDAEEKNPCLLAPDKGKCDGFESVYFFDIKSGECRHFIYSGCEGNDNRFKTVEECLATCLRLLS